MESVMGDAPRRQGRSRGSPARDHRRRRALRVHVQQLVSRNQWQVNVCSEGGGKWLGCYIKNGQTDDEDTIAQQMREKLEKVANVSAPAPAASAPSPLHAPEERTAAEIFNISPSGVGAGHPCNRPMCGERDRSRHRRHPRSPVDARAPRSRGCSTSSHPTPRAPARSPGRPGTLRRLPGPIGPRGWRSGDVAGGRRASASTSSSWCLNGVAHPTGSGCVGIFLSRAGTAFIYLDILAHLFGNFAER